MRLIDADDLLKKLRTYSNGSVIGLIENSPTINLIENNRRNCGNCTVEKKHCVGDRIWCELVQCDFPINGYCSYWRGE